MDALTVLLWLTASEGCPPPPAPTSLGHLVATPIIRSVCIDLELLRPEESKMYFRYPDEFHTDLQTMRRRYENCKDLPRLAPNIDRLPSIAQCDEALGILTKRIDEARNAAALNQDWRERIESEVYRMHSLYCFWRSMKMAKQGTREELGCVMAMISPEEWANGLWPSPWR
jgi:hypothetical protein